LYATKYKCIFYP